MRNIWDEKRIRTELARLDARTGLRGAGLPVRFANETEAVELHAVLLAFGKNGKVEKIERVFVP